jgi:hypothetical protein
MSEIPVQSEKLSLDKILDQTNFRLAVNAVINTRTPLEDGRSFSYKEVKYPYKDKTILIMGRHFPVDEVLKNGNSSCKMCYGKGYYYSEVSKKKLKDPGDFLVQENMLPKDLTPIEQKKWEEFEKNRANWTIMNICLCAVKATHKRNKFLLSNAQHNIWMTLDYDIINNCIEK